jgi:hypothetical protein
MKLVVVSSWFPYPPDNGSRMRAFHLLRALAARHRVSLVSFCETGQPEAERLQALLSFCASVDVVARGAFHEGPLTRRGLWSPVPRAYLQGFSPEMQAKVRSAVDGCDAAVALQIPAALYLRRVGTIPTVFEEAEVAVVRERFTSEERPGHRLRRGLTWWKYARFLRGLCRAFGHTTRSEERRVGKECKPECRSRWSPYH